LSLTLTDCSKSASDLGIDWSSVFGLDVTGTVSSSTLKGQDLQDCCWILPGQYGQFYRQTTKFQRVATLWSGSKYVGLATLIDWHHAAELAKGRSCPVPSSLEAYKSNEPTCMTYRDECSCE